MFFDEKTLLNTSVSIPANGGSIGSFVHYQNLIVLENETFLFSSKPLPMSCSHSTSVTHDSEALISGAGLGTASSDPDADCFQEPVGERAWDMVG